MQVRWFLIIIDAKSVQQCLLLKNKGNRWDTTILLTHIRFSKMFLINRLARNYKHITNIFAEYKMQTVDSYFRFKTLSLRRHGARTSLTSCDSLDRLTVGHSCSGRRVMTSRLLVCHPSLLFGLWHLIETEPSPVNYPAIVRLSIVNCEKEGFVNN